MTDRVLPRYPVYIPSKGRYDVCLTARMLVRDDVPFRLVVEEPERDAYAALFGPERLLVLPFVNQGLIAARNWIKAHSIAEGHARHWQLDDNISHTYRAWHGKRVHCVAGVALRVCEDFTDRYTNIAISGLNYRMFYSPGMPPFYLNVHVYSCSLINNVIPHAWRSRYNDDTDLCLQALADGWCTVLINAFLADKIATMVIKGGNTSDLYQGDGRLRMARALERLWPGVVSVDRRFRRPQHVVKDQWRYFDTPLIPRDDVDLDALAPNDYGLTLRQRAPIKSRELREFVERHAERTLDA